MYKDSTYKEKITVLKNWLPQILNDIRKDLRKDHWKQDPLFVKNYLGNKPQQKITQEDMTEGYTRALGQEEGAEAIAEFIATRWLFKNAEIYHFFEKELQKISPDFTQLNDIPAATADALGKQSSELFGSSNTYVFCVFNSVVFPEASYNKLKVAAENEQKNAHKQAEEKQAKDSQEDITRRYETQIARLTDKYEKRLAGMERKYVVDVEGLKKQIRSLQKRLEEVRT